MKMFILHKIGYTAGVYGNSGEQFLLIMIDDERYDAIVIDGMYGVEERVIAPLREAKYKQQWTPSFYGKATRKDCSYKFVLSEKQAIAEAQKFVDNVQELQ